MISWVANEFIWNIDDIITQNKIDVKINENIYLTPK
jgi:hypothetical protein